MEKEKKKIINIFFDNVYGKKVDTKNYNMKHDGKKGHWLELQFGNTPNGSNAPDIYGYELKNETSSKTTFGDWSPNYFIFKDSEFSCFSGEKLSEKQDSFCRIFGTKKTKKTKNSKDRYSWSGRVVPKINEYNDYGQKMYIDEESNIIITYCYSKDKRTDKSEIIPEILQKDSVTIAKWYGNTTQCVKSKSLKSKLESKFNDKGWFSCKTDADGYYREIVFGEPINYESWIKLVNKGIVYFDSGMHEGNARPYASWRANNSLWDELIIERYNEKI